MIKLLKKYSLRTKLVFLYAVLLIFSVIVVSYYSYWNIWQLLITNKITHLRAGAKPVIEHWLQKQRIESHDTHFKLNNKIATDLARDLTSRYTIAIILNKNGKIIANGRRLPEEPAAPNPDAKYFHRSISGENEVFYLKRVKDRRLLIILIPIRAKPGSNRIFGVIQISTSLSDINNILFIHAYRQIIVVGIILIAGILLGYWLVGLSLKDLRDLLVACQEISKGNFTIRADTYNRKDEIGRLSQAFNIMTDKLESLFDSQKRFAANAAHELLTPLTGLHGSLEVLLRGAQDDPETLNRLLKGMYREVTHLIKLCDHLLGISSIDNTSNISKKHIVLNEFMDEFIVKVKHLTNNHSIIIEKGPHLVLLADPGLLEQILFNLMSNAIRYSPSGSSVILSWKLIPDYVEIRVKDHGEGMDEETLSHAFEPFYRGQNKAFMNGKGTGLGLGLAKSMVEAHGGTMSIVSAQGRGTIVSFVLPL